MSDNDETPTAARKRACRTGKIKNETGNRYGRLLVIEKVGINKSHQATWLCLCDCGNKNVQVGAMLRIGKVVSCGCYGVEARRSACQTHGLSNSPIYNFYHAMLSRMRENHPNAHSYHGRGIRVCDRWLVSFQNFMDDMLPKLEEAARLIPIEDLTLERRDVNGNYTPENCCFATREVQGNNRRNNVRFDYAGENLTLSQWCRKLGMSPQVFQDRLKSGWTMFEVMNTPVRPKRKSLKPHTPHQSTPA